MSSSADNIPFELLHFNVHLKRGSAMTHVTVRELCGLQPADVVRVWIVEFRRRATLAEIEKLCKLIYQASR